MCTWRSPTCSTRSNHLGFQVDEASELEEIHGRLQSADAGVAAERNVSCCYARSDKY